MSKQILIDSFFGLVRTAIAEEGKLVDYYEESPDQGRAKGNMYRGVVKKVDAPIQAAFVRFGGGPGQGTGRDGFLALRDAGSGTKTIKVGDILLVQVVKDEVGDKGAALTTKLSLAGRYLVYIPERDGDGGISSRASEEERSALKKILEHLRIPEGGSVILRTAAINKEITELQADLDRLTRSYQEISGKLSQSQEPGILFRDVSPALRYLREYYSPEVERIWVNQDEVLDQCRQFFHIYEPASASKVVLSKDGALMFQKLGLEADVEKLNSRKITLPSGANIIIDQSEALVAIDVNSAKAGGRGEDVKTKPEVKEGTEVGRGRNKRGSDLEATVLAVNREAASEIARQLRLRDLGGIIIVDFIDMEEDKHRRQIEEIMRKAMSPDKAKVKIYDISPLGIMQISRQRLRKAGPNFSRLGCDACFGRGWHPSSASGAMTALRKVEEKLQGKRAGQNLTITAPYPIANKLMNEFREQIQSMEKRFGCVLQVVALPAHSGEAEISFPFGGQEQPGKERPGKERTGMERSADERKVKEPSSGKVAAGENRRNGVDQGSVANQQVPVDPRQPAGSGRVERGDHAGRGRKPEGRVKKTDDVASRLPHPEKIPDSKQGSAPRTNQHKHQSHSVATKAANIEDTPVPSEESGPKRRSRKRSRRGKGGANGSTNF